MGAAAERGLAGQQQRRAASSTTPNWRFRANASLDWSYGAFGATWMTRYHSGLVESCVHRGIGLCSDEDRRDDDDLPLRYDLPLEGAVKLGTNNLFKKSPPYSQNAFANSYDPQYDIPDSRYTYLEYVQRF